MRKGETLQWAPCLSYTVTVHGPLKGHCGPYAEVQGCNGAHGQPGEEPLLNKLRMSVVFSCDREPKSFAAGPLYACGCGKGAPQELRC